MVLTLVINGLSMVSRFTSLIMTDLPSCKWDEVPQFIAWLTITRFPWWVFGDETTIVPWVKINEVTEQGAPPSATFYGTIFKPMNIDHIVFFWCEPQGTRVLTCQIWEIHSNYKYVFLFIPTSPNFSLMNLITTSICAWNMWSVMTWQMRPPKTSCLASGNQTWLGNPIEIEF